MKKLLQFLKEIWQVPKEALYEEPYPYYKTENNKNCQCPFCGYLGSREEMRTHLLSSHENKI